MARNLTDLIDAVRAHASQHYPNAGWDIVIEAYDDDEIAAIIGNARTAKTAIKRVGDIVGIHFERRAADRQLWNW